MDDEYFDKIMKEIDKLSNLTALSIKDESCLHDSCSECNGTGKTKQGMICVHFISCNCSKCSITIH